MYVFPDTGLLPAFLICTKYRTGTMIYFYVICDLQNFMCKTED